MTYKDFTKTDGGIFALSEFSSNGVSCGVVDTGLLYSEIPCDAVMVTTENMFISDSLKLARERIGKNKINAVLFNNGIANSCVGDGTDNAKQITGSVADNLGINSRNVVMLSSGLVGISLSVKRITDNLKDLCGGLGTGNEELLCRSLCDDKYSVVSESACSYPLGGYICKTGAVIKKTTKNSKNLNSYTCVITTDACIEKELMQRALNKVYPITVGRLADECNSVSDAVLLLSSGFAGNPKVEFENTDYNVFLNSLYFVLSDAVKQLMKKQGDKVIEWICVRANSEATAENTVSCLCSGDVSSVFSDVIFSDLVTCLGKARGIPSISEIDISLKTSDNIEKIINKGSYADFNTIKIEEMLKSDEIKFIVDLNSGDCNAVGWSSI